MNSFLSPLQQALLSPNRQSLTLLVQDLIGPNGERRFDSLIGPYTHPMMLGTLELSCLGNYQSNIMMEECVTTILQLHGMNHQQLISQTQLQPLLERAEIPPMWLRPTFRFY